MDIITALQPFAWLAPYLTYLAAVIAVAAIVLPHLPTPATSSGVYYWIWTAIDILAQNYRNAKTAKAVMLRAMKVNQQQGETK